jgi:pimeloyl-[acyl-carrier protein] synthase
MRLRERFDNFLSLAEGASKMVAERLETGIVFNPLSRSMLEDPYPFYKKLRERDPFHRSRPAGGFILSRYDDIHAVLSERRFSSDERHQRRYARMSARNKRAGLPDPYEDETASMLRVDPPDHTRLRTLVNKAFTPRAVGRMRPRIEALIDEKLGQLPRHGRMELVRDLASPLPITVIAEMLAIPIADRERFQHWSREIVRTLGDNGPEDRRASRNAMEELGGYLEELVELRRKDPRDDLFSGLVAAEEAGDRLSTRELLTTCTLLLVAGNETTTNLISNSVVALLRNRDQLDLLRSEPKRVAGAVDELLRFDSPVQLTSRMVVQDEEFRGHMLKKGQQLVLLLAAGNRDPERFEHPDRLDVTRENVRHLSFSHGLHRCLGAQLALLEGGLALEALITRFPDLRFAGEELQWGNNTVLRGPRVLPLEF